MKRLALAFILAVGAAPACSSDQASSASTTVSDVALPAWTNLVLNQGIATHVDP